MHAALLVVPLMLLGALAAPTSVTVSVDTLRPMLTLPPQYLGFTLDWWPPQQEDFGTSTVNMITCPTRGWWASSALWAPPPFA